MKSVLIGSGAAMLKKKFVEAHDLIVAGRYLQARVLLYSIDHPKAIEWLEKLDALEQRRRRSPLATFAIIGFSIVFLITAALGSVIVRDRLMEDEPSVAPSTAVAFGTAAPQATGTLVVAVVTPDPNATPRPRSLTQTLSQAFAALDGVLAVEGLMVQESTLASHGFDFNLTVMVEVTDGLNTQTTAERLLRTARDALGAQNVTLLATLDDSVSPPTEYTWSNAERTWSAVRAYTTAQLGEAFRALRGVEVIGALSVTPPEPEAARPEVVIEAGIGVLSGFNTQKMAQSLFDAAVAAFETDALDMTMTLSDGALSTTYEWSHSARTWAVRGERTDLG